MKEQGRTVTVTTSTGARDYVIKDSFNDPTKRNWTIGDIMDYIDKKQKKDRRNDLHYGIAIGAIIGAVLTMGGLLLSLLIWA